MPAEEFQIRAWRSDDAHAQVLVHSSPAGDIRRPITVPCDLGRLHRARDLLTEPQWFLQPGLQERLVELGRLLAEVLLPRPVYALLTSSLDRLDSGAILRVRLSLDEDLVDMPWEYLFRPDVEAPAADLSGFLLFDHRISLVREAPRTTQPLPGVLKSQRILFVGALWTVDGREEDRWEVRAEYDALTEALASVKDLVSLEFLPASGDLEESLSERTAILHYSGHTDVARGSGYLVREVVEDADGEFAVRPPHRLHSAELANMLRRAQIRLAVFSGCNSGRWQFVEPLLRAGVPAVIGAQGNLSAHGARVFCETLYEKLTVGLSLDEALISARFRMLRDGGFRGEESLEWGQFMAYLPTAEAVLIPRRARKAAGLRDTARESSEATIAEVADRLGESPAAPSSVSVTVLRRTIVKSFTVDELALLCDDVRQTVADDGVELDLDLDAVGGRNQPEEVLVLKLIQYLERRGFLSYLVQQVRVARPGKLQEGS
ncbi:MAG: CHAT domain-containing protein [Actinomycetota bacterium]